MPEPGHQKRMKRFDLNLSSSISKEETGENLSLCLETQNICSGGAFFLTERSLPVGTHIEIELVLSLEALKKLKGKKTLIRTSGKVIRIENQGMAVRFDKKYKIMPIG